LEKSEDGRRSVESGRTAAQAAGDGDEHEDGTAQSVVVGQEVTWRLIAF